MISFLSQDMFQMEGGEISVPLGGRSSTILGIGEKMLEKQDQRWK